LADFANPRGLTVTQVSIAWLLAQKPWIVPIPGTTKQVHLFENLSAAEIEITSVEWEELNKIVSNIQIQGVRYPTQQKK
jgi:aryl-alcohol dehydrogenase-like predicted oxidoreductase